MATCTAQQVFDQARAYLSDTQVAGGEVFTNTALQPHLNETYRRVYRNMQGLTKRIQRTVYLNLPPNTTVLIPSAYGITDFAEPTSIEERPAQNPIAISTTSNTTPITVTTTNPHGLGSNGDTLFGTIGGVVGSTAPWGHWGITITGASTFTLNGSVRDGVAGTGGYYTPWSQLTFREMQPLDFDAQGLDGVQQQYLGQYIWRDEQINFRGCTGTQQLRIMYWASGSPPSLANQDIGIDDILDVLACGTAANAAHSKQWYDLADRLNAKAWGEPGPFSADTAGMLGEFIKIQVSAMQRGPNRRALPFRSHRTPYDSTPIW